MSNPESLRVLIVDDHQMVRGGLRGFLSGDRAVKSYPSAIFQKRDLTDRTQAALFAVRRGLVDGSQ